MSEVFQDAIDRLKNFLVTRKQAYCQVFKLEDKFAKTVLEDLAQFCRANETTFHADPRVHAVLEGRREVFLRITAHLELDSAELMKLFGRKDLV